MKSPCHFPVACWVLLQVGWARPASRVPVGSRGGERTHRGWVRSREPCVGGEPVEFTVFLAQQNLEQLSAAFRGVSDPDSPLYGRFWTKREVDDLVAAAPDAHAAVSRWLAGHGVPPGNVEVRADAVAVSTDCATASGLLAVPFHRYEQKGTGRSRTLFLGDATIPAELEGHVDFIMGASELWGAPPSQSRRARPGQARQQTDDDLKVTPKLLRSFYSVPDNETNASPDKNYQAVVAFDDYFSSGALGQFFANTDGGLGPTPEVQVIGVDCLNDAKPCDQVESDLDVQYLTAMSGRGSVRTLFHNTNSSSGWVLSFSEQALQLSPLPMVFTISYGWAELQQCDLAVMTCMKLGYDANRYVNRTNTNFQKLALMGASILVSDGDDGAQGVQPSGWDPLDPDHWCPDGYTCYPKTSSKCGEFVLRNTTTGDSCVYPVGHMGQACSWLFLGDMYQDEDIQKALKAANPSCKLDFFIDGSYNEHMYSECDCNQLAPLRHEDLVSEPMSDKDDFTSKRIFYADFPTSSPYVTSVGATVFKTVDGKSVSEEHAASIKDGAIITTGGGFSTMAEAPLWQKDVVEAYTRGPTTKPPAGTYDASKRGYPDLTLNGHNYQVWTTKKANSASCPCELHGVDGTSASSPAVAGLVSLLNGHLLAAGRSQLGFLNPLLYAAYSKDESIFNDVTIGDTSCTRDYCMKYGFTAGKGWDPVAGLGSLNYERLKEYVLAGARSSSKEILV